MILYLLVLVALIAVIPYKLLTSVQSKCAGCGGKVFYSRKKRNFNCPHCGAVILRNGNKAQQP